MTVQPAHKRRSRKSKFNPSDLDSRKTFVSSSQVEIVIFRNGTAIETVGPMTRRHQRRSLKLPEKLPLGWVGALALFCSGCAMCCGPYDDHYPTYGGIVQRSNPVWGRVGSIYSDPGPFGGPLADSNLTPHDGQTSIDSPLEDINGRDSSLEPRERLFDDGDEDNSDVLPPPNLERPGPDEDTRSIRRLRNQSLNQNGRQQWR